MRFSADESSAMKRPLGLPRQKYELTSARPGQIFGRMGNLGDIVLPASAEYKRPSVAKLVAPSALALRVCLGSQLRLPVPHSRAKPLGPVSDCRAAERTVRQMRSRRC